MKNIQTILDIILSKDIFQYISIDRLYKVVYISDKIDEYLGKSPKIGDDILSYLPELVGYESEIEDVLNRVNKSYLIDSISINNHYFNIYIEYYSDENIIILLQNITDITNSNQKLLQYSNEATLLNSTLENIINRQNALVFLTNRDDIIYANKKFLDYFGIDTLVGESVDVYRYFDTPLDSYDTLFPLVDEKEIYISIKSDTFILKATLIESSHKLFTLSRVTELSNEKNIDMLTGLYKKPYFISALKRYLEREDEYAVIVIDLDNFKRVNDIYGHLAGDDVLKEFALLIKGNIRADDIFARWGGEEFLMLLKNTSLDNAIKKLEQVHAIIENHQFRHIGRLTASFGITNGVKSDSIDSILKRADNALYEAKDRGKNQIVSQKV